MGAQQPQGQQTDPQEGQQAAEGAGDGTQAQQPQKQANEPGLGRAAMAARPSTATSTSAT